MEEGLEGLGDLQEQVISLELCIKFAGLLIDMVRRVKANRQSRRTALHEQIQGLAEYFIHTNDLKQFFKACDESISIYVPLSVGQPYHEADSAASQIACLQNCRDAYEAWAQDQITKQAVSPHKITIKWDAILIDANITQALNEIEPVEIDLNPDSDQCNRILQDKRLEEHERKYIDKGRTLEENYRRLFTGGERQRQKQKDVEVILRVKRSSTIRWNDFKRYYNDSNVMNIVRRLEYCFKLGANAINQRHLTNKKFPAEIEKLYKNRAFDDWASFVFVNDLAYVIIENIIVPCKILPKPVPGETQIVGMMYPGPLNMILDTGRKILSCVCKELFLTIPISDATCLYLQAEKINPNNAKQDKNASLFSGKLNLDGSRSLPAEDLLSFRKRFIENATPPNASDKLAIVAMRVALKHLNERDERQQATFEQGPYANFISYFFEELENHEGTVSLLCNESKLLWDPKKPLASILAFFKSHCSPQIFSSHDSFLEQHDAHNDLLIPRLELFVAKYQKTRSNEKHKEYLVKIACRLVREAVECQPVEDKKDHREQSRKKSKSSIRFFGDDALAPDEEVKYFEETRPTARVDSQHLHYIGCLYYIRKIIEIYGDDLSLIYHHKHYPHPIPQADYHSTPASQQSGSYPLSNSGSFPLSQSK